jgi:hypothetical protein
MHTLTAKKIYPVMGGILLIICKIRWFLRTPIRLGIQFRNEHLRISDRQVDSLFQDGANPGLRSETGGTRHPAFAGSDPASGK